MNNCRFDNMAKSFCEVNFWMLVKAFGDEVRLCNEQLSHQDVLLDKIYPLATDDVRPSGVLEQGIIFFTQSYSSMERFLGLGKTGGFSEGRDGKKRCLGQKSSWIYGYCTEN